MLRFIRNILIVCAVLYIIPLILIFVFQREFIYLPPNGYQTPTDVGLASVQEVRVVDHNNQNLTGWWLPPKSDDHPVIVLFHGNGAAVYANHVKFRDLHAQGYGVYSVGYAGYPGSDGKPSQDSIVSGATAQYDWIVKQGINADRIVFYGISLGTGVAAQVAFERRPKALILEAPFYSAAEVAKTSMPVFPVSVLMKDRFETHKALEVMDMPLIWVHGTDDDVVPLPQGRRLYEGYTGPKTKKIIPGGRHMGLWDEGARDFILGSINTL